MTAPDLGGRVAVVTGAARGIGEAYARGLARCGASIVVADIDERAAQEVAGAIAGDGGVAHAVAVDVSDRDSTLALAAAVTARFGTCHIIVNNAAIYHSMRLDPQLTVDIGYWRKVFSVNLDGPLLVTQALAPMLVDAGWGRVVMQSSAAAYGNGGVYGTAKLALHSLSRGFARELGAHGITVNAIVPGPIATEATAVTVPSDRIDALVAAACIKRIGTVDDLVGTLLFLCSDAASWVTAQALVIDGGVTARV
ncbi:MAG TPA: SDR family oxidoreductase [Acidimicrobiia bacterium]|nr:SDR family oxidoreductase [Acidimicrobiia bacterium]